MRLLRNNGLLLANVFLFLAFLLGLLLAGHLANNEELSQHQQPPIGLGTYATSSEFGQAVFENWESEFLQMGMYVVLTAFLVQKGSAESRPLDGSIPSDAEPEQHRGDASAPWPVRQGSALVLWLYKNSLAVLFVVLFALSIWLHAIAGAGKYNEEQLQHGGPPATAWEFARTSEFWFESFQNWQSEFLAVAVLVAGTIWLRQHRSPQSKPVHAAHGETGS